MEELTQTDYERLAAFRFALRRFVDFSTEAARAVGLTTHQHQALLAIRGAPSGNAMTIGRLAEQLLVAPHTAAELVARLEAGSLIEKSVDRDDRRRVLIALTPKADALLRDLTLVHRREVRELAPRLLALVKDLERDQAREPDA